VSKSPSKVNSFFDVFVDITDVQDLSSAEHVYSDVTVASSDIVNLNNTGPYDRSDVVKLSAVPAGG
jgi:hypothetical protein